MNSLEPYLIFFPILYFIYQLDPFKQNPKKRNYLKLKYNRRFLIVNSILSTLIFCLKIYLVNSGNSNFLFSSVNLIFIIETLFLLWLSNKISNKDFIFIQRGDFVKGKFIDHLFSFLLIVTPLIVSLVIDSYLIE